MTHMTTKQQIQGTSTSGSPDVAANYILEELHIHQYQWYAG